MKQETSIRLFAIPTSPFAMKVGCYLAFKKLDYELVGVNPVTFQAVRFTGARQVPILQIGEQWKLESSQIGHWIDELYPERALLGFTEEDRRQIIAQDNWVTDQLIPSLFRLSVDWPSLADGLANGWKLARAVNDATQIPAWIRLFWPILIKRANFIVAMVNEIDRSESVESMQQRLLNDFVARLEGGPFLAGMNQPTLADLSAFPIVVFAHRFGMKGSAPWFSDKNLLGWCHAVQSFLPANPFLVQDRRLIYELPKDMLIN